MTALAGTYWNVIDVITVGTKVFRVTDVAVEIARLESGWVPDIHVVDSDDNSYGLWQINLAPGAHTIASLNAIADGAYTLRNAAQLLTPTMNAAVAQRLWKQGAGGAGTFAGPWDATYQTALTNLEREGREVTEPLPNAREAGLYPGQLTIEESVGNALDVIKGLVGTLLNPTFWKFVGLGALGVLLVIFTLVLFTDSGNKAVSGATTAVVAKGKA